MPGITTRISRMASPGFSEEYTNDVSKLNMSNALQAVKTSTGQIICAANATGNNAPGCVPWNIFQPGGVTPAALAYISVPGEQKGFTQEMVWEGDITGDLGKMGIQSPWASSGLGVSVGSDWREEKAQLLPDEEFITQRPGRTGLADTADLRRFHGMGGLYGSPHAHHERPAVREITRRRRRLPLLGLLALVRVDEHLENRSAVGTGRRMCACVPTYNVAVRAPNIQELYLQQRVQLDGTAIRARSATGRRALGFRGCLRELGRHRGRVRQHRQQPREPVQRPRGRQPELEARNRAIRRRSASCSRRQFLPVVQRDRRLLRHQDQERHRHLRRQFDSQQLLELGQPAVLQPGSSCTRHRDGFERLAVARHRRLHHRRHATTSASCSRKASISSSTIVRTRVSSASSISSSTATMTCT